MNTDITKQLEMVLYRTEDDNVTVSALIKDETIWLTQKAMAELFGIDKSGISRHLAKILKPVSLMRKWLLQKLQQPLSTEQCRIKRRLFLPIIIIWMPLFL